MFRLLLLLTCSVLATSSPSTIVNGVARSADHPHQDKIRQCSCQEANQCKESSLASLSTCYYQCDSVFEGWRNETEKDLISCFHSHSMAGIDAEECLFKNMGQFCVNDSSTQMIAPSDFTSRTALNANLDTANDIITHFPFLKRAVDQFTVFFKFFQCAKNCVHKRMASCFQSNRCGVQLPSTDVMQSVLDKCNKNHKISNSLLSTCQCLAFRKKVKSLHGVCAIIGNPLFIQNV